MKIPASWRGRWICSKAGLLTNGRRSKISLSGAGDRGRISITMVVPVRLGRRWARVYFLRRDRSPGFPEDSAEACGKADFLVHAYCLMSNHFHLVVETPNGASSRECGGYSALTSYTLPLSHRRKRRYKSRFLVPVGERLETLISIPTMVFAAADNRHYFHAILPTSPTHRSPVSRSNVNHQGSRNPEAQGFWARIGLAP